MYSNFSPIKEEMKTTVGDCSNHDKGKSGSANDLSLFSSYNAGVNGRSPRNVMDKTESQGYSTGIMSHYTFCSSSEKNKNDDDNDVTGSFCQQRGRKNDDAFYRHNTHTKKSSNEGLMSSKEMMLLSRRTPDQEESSVATSPAAASVESWKLHEQEEQQGIPNLDSAAKCRQKKKRDDLAGRMSITPWSNDHSFFDIMDLTTAAGGGDAISTEASNISKELLFAVPPPPPAPELMERRPLKRYGSSGDLNLSGPPPRRCRQRISM